ncbi:MAG: hypothetical protein JXC85_03080 [Candidatus Aenigmarchaeota archaeon]|nr:hypothetical protein [Candidatus Aenigmarchaeota archaeon]
MHKAPLAIVLVILLALTSVVWILRDFLAPMLNMAFYMVLGTFIVIFGLMLGIKFMSDMFK